MYRQFNRLFAAAPLVLASMALSPLTAAAAADDDDGGGANGAMILSAEAAAGVCAERPQSVRVTVTGIRKHKGQIVADLHDDNPDHFLKEIIGRVFAPVAGDTVEFCIPVAGPGVYAIGVYHDKNGNKKFDKNFLGIPKESFGVSNNPKYGKHSPKFAEAAFEVGETGAEIAIRLVSARDILF